MRKTYFEELYVTKFYFYKDTVESIYVHDKVFFTRNNKHTIIGDLRLIGNAKLRKLLN